MRSSFSEELDQIMKAAPVKAKKKKEREYTLPDKYREMHEESFEWTNKEIKHMSKNYDDTDFMTCFQLGTIYLLKKKNNFFAYKFFQK